jgi:hypothetical protein
MSKQQGSSLLALTELGQRLGYQIICTTTFNAFFIRNDFMKYILLGEEGDRGGDRGDRGDFSLSALHPSPSSMMTDIFQTYDGELKLCGPKKLIWHKVAINLQSIQPLKKKSSRVFPFAPPSTLTTGSVEYGTVTQTSISSMNSCGDRSAPLWRLEAALQILIDCHQIINTQTESMRASKKTCTTSREDFERWCTPSLIGSMIENCDQVINIAREITDGVPFEMATSPSPYHEIAIDVVMWCILILCHASHTLLDAWHHSSSVVSVTTSTASLPETVTHLLTSSLQSIHTISALYQSVRSSESLPITSQAYQHSMCFYCLFDCCLSPYRSLFSEITLIRQGVLDSISRLASEMNSKIKINKNNRKLFNFSDSGDSDSGWCGAGLLNSNKVWRALFEKSYWIWLQQTTAADGSDQSQRCGLEFHNLITNNLSDQLMDRIAQMKLTAQLPPISSSHARTHPRGGEAEMQKSTKSETNAASACEDVGGDDEDLLFDVISRVCWRLNLRKKYQECSNQRKEVMQLEQQVTQYRRISFLLFGLTLASLVGSSFLDRKWRY